jgi:hypothetical protein
MTDNVKETPAEDLPETPELRKRGGRTDPLIASEEAFCQEVLSGELVVEAYKKVFPKIVADLPFVQVRRASQTFGNRANVAHRLKTGKLSNGRIKKLIEGSPEEAHYMTIIDDVMLIRSGAACGSDVDGGHLIEAIKVGKATGLDKGTKIPVIQPTSYAVKAHADKVAKPTDAIVAPIVAPIATTVGAQRRLGNEVIPVSALGSQTALQAAIPDWSDKAVVNEWLEKALHLSLARQKPLEMVVVLKELGAVNNVYTSSEALTTGLKSVTFNIDNSASDKVTKALNDYQIYEAKADYSEYTEE